jgi:hypothetical protein
MANDFTVLPTEPTKPSGVSHEFNHHALTTRFADAV